jgi:hypothetical protein
MCPISRSLLCSLVYRASAAVWRHHSPATNIRGRRFHHFCCLASRRSALGRRLIVQPSVPSGLDIYSAAKKFETGFFCDFANVEGFQQHSFVGHNLNLVTRTRGVLFKRAVSRVGRCSPPRPSSCKPWRRKSLAQWTGRRSICASNGRAKALADERARRADMEIVERNAAEFAARLEGCGTPNGAVRLVMPQGSLIEAAVLPLMT